MDMNTQEEIIYNRNVPFRAIIFSRGILWHCTVGLFYWACCLFVIDIFRSFSWHVKITNERICITKGILSKAVEDIEMFRIKDTAMEQNLLQRIFGVGTIKIISDDSRTPIASIPISSPEQIRGKIRSYIRKDRKEMNTISIN